MPAARVVLSTPYIGIFAALCCREAFDAAWATEQEPTVQAPQFDEEADACQAAPVAAAAAAAGVYTEHPQQEDADPPQHAQQRRQAESAAQDQPLAAEQLQQQLRACYSEPCVAIEKGVASRRLRPHPRCQQPRPHPEEPASMLASSCSSGASSAAAAGPAATAELAPGVQSCSDQGMANARDAAPPATASEGGEEAALCQGPGASLESVDELASESVPAASPAGEHDAAAGTAELPAPPRTPEPAAALPASTVFAAALDAAPSAAAVASPACHTSAAGDEPANAARPAAGKLTRGAVEMAPVLARTAARLLQRALALAAAVFFVLLSILLALMLPSEARRRL